MPEARRNPNRSTPATPDARDVVMRRLASELRRRPNFGLTPLAVVGLDDRDAALARALYTESIRRLLTAEHLLNLKLNQPFDQLEPRLQAALVAGTVQLLFFDQLPDYAVLDETVDWVGRNVREKARGITNAVLRRIVEMRGERRTSGIDDRRLDEDNILPLSDGGTIALDKIELPHHPVERLSIQTSHPAFLVERWRGRFGHDQARKLLLHDLTQPPTILVNTPAGLHADRVGPHHDARFRVWLGNHADLVELLRRFPDCRVQDPASFAACASTAQLALADRLIVDVCAGSGTKTAHLAELHPYARIIATEVDDRRREILRQRFEGHDRVSVISPERLIHFAGEAALLVLDVPCSNSGVLARRVEAKYRFEPSSLNSLINLQRQITADSLRLRAPDGLILYSTCSLEPEENQLQAQWIEKWHGLRAKSQQLRLPEGSPGDSPSLYSDGGYHALLG